MSAQPVLLPRSAACLVTAYLWAVAGCGGGNPAASLDYRPPATPLRPGAVRTLHLPDDQPYSLHRAPVQRTPRLAGDVKVAAEAHPDGTARARTEVIEEGEGWAGFQLGHAIRNETIRQITLDVQIELDYAVSVHTRPDPLQAGASVALDVLARDQLNRRLRQLTVLSHESGDGPLESRDTRRVRWTLILAPGDAVTLYVGGQTAGKLRTTGASGPPPRVTAELKLTRLRMIIVPQPRAGGPSDAQDDQPH